METCAVIADEYGKSLLSEIKTLEKFVGSGPPSDILTPLKTLHDLARLYIGESVLDELLTDNFTNEQIWQQLKIATSSGEKTFENASARLQKKRKRMDNAVAESIEKKLCTAETTDETEDASDAESDDELKRITDRWNIDGRQPEEEDDDDDDDEDDENDEEEDEDGKVEKDEEDVEDDLKENFDVSDDESPLDTLKNSLKSKKKKTSEVDDKFFSLEDMHSFLDQQDRLANREVSEEADEDDNDNYMFRDTGILSDDDENDEKNAKYSEFFDDLEEKNTTKDDEKDDEEEEEEDDEEDVDDMEHDSDEENGKDDDEAIGSDSLEDDEDEEEDMEQDDIVGDDIDQHKENKLNKMQKTNNEPKSAFQRKQELLKKQITDVEELNLAEKPWHLRGEVTAADRPENSLLTTHLDYKFTSAPTIDDDDKNIPTIEELLRKYYDSDAFVVNVTRKVKPVGTAVKYRKDVVLDHEKSKLGLAEILERDYLGQTQTRNQKEEEEYKENRKILDNLLLGLQMMFSNTPVTVMPPKLDLQIVENAPAITVEEVAPVYVSDAARLTAEEVQGKRKGELVGATEKTKTNRKRERRLKKKFQHQKALQKKVRAADPNSKEAQEEAQKQLERKSKRGKHITIHETDKKKKKLSSKDFYNQLQNQVTSSISKKKEGLDKKKRKKNRKEES